MTTCVNTVVLWADQICIDQSNETEKEQQVQLMSRIYAQAQQVTGWLGLHENDSYLAFDLLLVLGRTLTAEEAQADSEWRRAADAVMKDGHVHKVEDLFNPASKRL